TEGSARLVEARADPLRRGARPPITTPRRRVKDLSEPLEPRRSPAVAARSAHGCAEEHGCKSNAQHGIDNKRAWGSLVPRLEPSWRRSLPRRRQFAAALTSASRSS